MDRMSHLKTALDRLRAGDSQGAAGLCRELLAANPGDAEALNILGAALLQAGDSAGAEPILLESCRLAPAFADPRRNLAALYLRSGQPAKALPFLRQLSGLLPGDQGIALQLAQALVSLGHHAPAADLYQEVLARAPGQPEALLGLAACHLAAGRGAEAAQTAEKLLQIAPGHAQALRVAGAARLHLLDHARAADHFQELSRLEPRAADAWCNLGMARLGLEQSQAAREALQKSLQLDPSLVPAHINLANLLERLHENQAGLETARAGLARLPDNPDLALTQAKCLRRLGRGEEAAASLEGLLQRAGQSLTPKKQAHLFFELAAVFDGQGKAARAFEAAARANRLMARAEPRAAAWERAFLTELDGLARTFTPQWTAAWTPPPAPDGPPPILLAGFPRSGTTLLGRILDAHPQLATLEEKDHLHRLLQKAARTGPGGFPDGLAGLSDRQLGELRAFYRDDLAGRLPAGSSERPIDKSPLDTAYAGPLFRIFPEVKVIFLARHPADVMLSCFMQDFYVQPRSAAFLSLPGAMGLYRTVLRLWRQYLGLLPIDHLVVRYEDLVVDFAAQAKRVLNFLGLPWSDQVLGYRERFQKDGLVGSISYHQVAEPINRKAVARHARYARELAPFARELAELGEFLGYEMKGGKGPGH